MISIERYSRLLQAPHLGSALAASIVGRIPIGMATLSVLLFMQSRVASFAWAGTVAGLYVFGLAALAPFLGRLIDRFGPRPVIAFCAAAFPCALIVLIVLVEGAAPRWAIALAAVLAGAAFPPITICMRALYPRVVIEPGLLQAAYSLDSALIETVFILGPALVALFVAAGRPEGAIVFAAFCSIVGCATFLRTPAIRQWRRSGRPGRGSLLGPLVSDSLRAVLSATILYAAAFGMFEVAVSALASARGSPAAAGVLLALASTGSALGAIVYGSRDWEASAENQFVLGLIAMASGIALLAPIGNIYLFGALAVIACAPMAPVIASQSVLIARVAPRAMLAEAFTWAATMLLVGVSAGIAAGGMLVDRTSPMAVCFGAAGATALAALIGWNARRRIDSAAVQRQA
ncbi:MAG TPA: MFS transporter [Burkholderiales bacterium]|nr:MFS transporter [Burkholderiales bacterium]